MGYRLINGPKLLYSKEEHGVKDTLVMTEETIS